MWVVKQFHYVVLFLHIVFLFGQNWLGWLYAKQLCFFKPTLRLAVNDTLSHINVFPLPSLLPGKTMYVPCTLPWYACLSAIQKHLMIWDWSLCLCYHVVVQANVMLKMGSLDLPILLCSECGRGQTAFFFPIYTCTSGKRPFPLDWYIWAFFSWSHVMDTMFSPPLALLYKHCSSGHPKSCHCMSPYIKRSTFIRSKESTWDVSFCLCVRICMRVCLCLFLFVFIYLMSLDTSPFWNVSLLLFSSCWSGRKFYLIPCHCW